MARVTLPERFKNLVFQPASLLLRLSIIKWKSLWRGAEWRMIKPRCFLKFSLAWIERMFTMDFFSWRLQFLEKITFDLERLIFWLEWRLKDLRTLIIVVQLSILTFEKRVRSSTKKR